VPYAPQIRHTNGWRCARYKCKYCIVLYCMQAVSATQSGLQVLYARDDRSQQGRVTSIIACSILIHLALLPNINRQHRQLCHTTSTHTRRSAGLFFFHWIEICASTEFWQELSNCWEGRPWRTDSRKEDMIPTCQSRFFSAIINCKLGLQVHYKNHRC